MYFPPVIAPLFRLLVLLPWASLALLAVSASGATLKLVPLFYNGSYGEFQNEGRAITPDGGFVAVIEYKTNTLWGAYMDGILYNVTNNTTYALNGGGAYAGLLTGIGYRTSGGQKQIVLAGADQSGPYQANWMTADGGVTWGAKRRNSTFTDCKNLPLANSLGASTGSDKYYCLWGENKDLSNQRHLYTGTGSGTWAGTFTMQYFAIENPDGGNMSGVASTGTAAGRAVGWYQDNYTYSPNQLKVNYIVEYPPAGPIGYPQSYANTWAFKGLNGSTNGAAWSVSADGTKIFGHSPLTTETNLHGYKAVVGTTINSWIRTDRLPDFGNTAGSAVLATPYGCTPDGRYAVGMNYRGTERAVLWDTGDANPANWTVVDLTDIAAAEGLLGSSPNPRWSTLTRAYSVGTNAAGDPVVTGIGSYWDGTGWYTRAFVMTVPQCSLTAAVGGITSPVYDSATTVIVTGCNAAASAIKVYYNGSVIGSAAGGSASTVVTVAPPALVAGWVLKATQVVNGQESCLNNAPSVIVTTPANPPPTITLTAPTNQSVYIAPASIALAATVTTNLNTINSVAFYNWSTNLLATVTTAPFTYSWLSVPAGTYSLSARVNYNSGSSVDSAAAIVTVNNPSSGSTLALIPLAPWQTGEYQNQGRAISPDGKYVVGPCYVSTPGDGDGFFYDVANNTVIQPSASSHPDQQYPPNMLTGIGYRTDPIYGKQLILDGQCNGYQANWSTTDGGATWGAMRADTSLTAGFALPVANSLGAVTGSDKFYTIIGNYAADINNQRQCYTCKGSNTWSSSTPCQFNYSWFYIDNPDAANMYGVAGATGRAVGYYRDQYLDAGKRHNYVVDYPPKGSIGWPQSYVGTWAFNGLDGTVVGEAFSVSADGNKIFGRSPTPTDSNWHGYKAIVTSATNSLQSVQKLPDFPDTGGSTRLVTPYGCTMDGRYAVGMNYRGQEKAVLWDTGSANSANWTVLDLTERAAAEGILGNFTTLNRAHSVGTNSAGNPVITGYGTYYDGTGYRARGFVMVVGTPRPVITSITGAGTSTVTVAYTNTVPGKIYTLQYNANLNSPDTWATVGSKTANSSSDFQAQNSALASPRYYRVYCQ